MLNKFLTFFVPKNTKFFNLFEQAADNLVQAARLNKDMFYTENETERRRLAEEIHRLEKIGDEFTHAVFTELSSNFITPFDREDIHGMATQLDNIVDYIDITAKKVEYYNFKHFSDSALKLADLLLDSALQVKIAVYSVDGLRDIQKAKQAINEIDAIEDRADDVYNMAVGFLFENETDAIELIKQKEVLYNLEEATDICLDLANVLETIIIKHS